MAVVSTGRFIKPEDVVTHFHLREGDKVADFGAGCGFFIRALSRAVGADGRVYACDIQKCLIDAIGALKNKESLSNVEPLWCDLEEAEGSGLRDGLLDAGVLVNTLFQLEDRAAVLHEIHRVLRPGGKLLVVDWTESFGGLGPRPSDVIDVEQAQTDIDAVGFTFKQSFDVGDHHYGLGFQKNKI